MKVFNQKIILFLVWTFCTSTIFAQLPEKDKGVELYKKGDYTAAIIVLKETNESKELYYLALSYEKTKQHEEAKESLRKAIAKSYDEYVRRFNDWQKASDQNGIKPLSEFLQQIQSNNEGGFLAAKKAMELDSSIFKGNDLAYKAEVLRKLILIARTADIIYSNANNSISPVQMTEKPRAVYPKDMSGSPILRRNHSSNKPVKVTLLTIFGADGEITLLIPVDSVIDAYTVESLNAAAKIKFNPAVINDKPVSSFHVIEYSFSIG